MPKYFNDLTIEEMFEHHDHTYMMSDDHRYYKEGMEQRRLIEEKVDSIGGWNNDYGYFLDLIAYLELNHQFETLYLSQSLGFHRQHAENASKRSYREVGYGKSVPVVIQRGFELLETPELQRDFLFHICSMCSL